MKGAFVMKCFNPPRNPGNITYIFRCPGCDERLELPIHKAISIVPHCRIGAVLTFVCPECELKFDTSDIGVDTDHEQIKAICSNLGG
jgi:C4-type Zn-finger protein